MSCPFRNRVAELLVGGEIDDEIASELLASHRAGGCEPCGQRRSGRRGPRAAHGNLLAFPDRAGRADALVERHAAAQRDATRRDFDALAELPLEERLERIRRSRSRFRSLDLVDRLLRESIRQTLRSAWRSDEWAATAEAVLFRLPPASSHDPRVILAGARVLAYRANARRAVGLLKAAETGLDQVRRLVRRESLTDPALLSELDNFRGSLLREQGAVREAIVFHSRAARRSLLNGHHEVAALAYVALALGHRTAGEPARALEEMRRARALLPDEPDGRVRLLIRHNEADSLIALGQLDEAERIITTNDALYRACGPSACLRGEWLRAQIDHARGRLEPALAIFESVRRGFEELDYPVDRMIVGVEIASLHLELGRTGRAIGEIDTALPLIHRTGDTGFLDRALELRDRAALAARRAL